MNWPEEIELTIDGLAQGGAGVGRWDGRPVFVQGALPGETVRVQLHERREAWARGSMRELLFAPAAERTSPPCPVYGVCGGCDWQHLALSGQRAAKQTILHEQLTHVGRYAAATVEPTAARAAWHYRSSARFHVADRQIGFYAAGSRRIVAFDACPLLSDQLNVALTTMRAHLPLAGLKQVTVRLSTTTNKLHILLSGQGSQAWSSWARKLHTALPTISGISAEQGASWRMLAGAPYLYEELGGIQLRISPTSFFQANVERAAALLQSLEQQLDWSSVSTMLDGFCGVGTFVLPLAARVKQAWGIEEHPAAIKDARASAEAAAITNISWYTGRMEDVLPTLSIRPDLVLLDPPRRGCAPATLQALLEQRPQQIAYVSCHPGTLSRDIRVLSEAGYQLKQAQPYDFFPQTSHIESLTLLQL